MVIVIEPHLLPNRVPRPAERALPEPVAQDRRLVKARPRIRRQRRSSNERRNTEHREEVVSDGGCVGAIGPIAAGDVRVERLGEREVRDRGGHPLVVKELCGSDLADLAVRRKVTDRYELAGCCVRKRLEKHRVHHAEHRRVEGDAERERHRRDRGECSVPQKRPHSQTCVAGQLVDEIAHVRKSPLGRADRNRPGTTRPGGAVSGALPAAFGRRSPASASQLAEHSIERANQEIRIFGVERHWRPDLHHVVIRAIGSEEDTELAEPVGDV
jgi:hypothetical protein